MLSNLLLDMYKGLIEFLGWLVLLGSVIAGFVWGKNYGYMWNMQILWGILGAVFGALIGLFVDAVLLPPLLILFKIYDRLGTITDRGL